MIGRDQETRRLRVTNGTQSKLFGPEGSVPDYVSRQHARLTIDKNGEYVLENLKANNVTFVNGLCIETKRVTENYRIELGASHYRLEWSFLQQMLPTLIDIRPLEQVWNKYHETKMKYQIAERRFNALRSATGIITMTAILLSMLGGRGTVYYILYGLAIGITLIFTIKAWVSSSKVPKQNDELDKNFKREYVCPNPRCQHFMGYQSYDILTQNSACPYCKGQYRK